ncbi:MAG: tetratricopeptide repeat protein [Myxococcales bacterium]|nr:tetratricopeptide repeat protein [Myxococcales bacterium]
MTLVLDNKRKGRWTRWLRRVGIYSVATLIALLLLYTAFRRWTLLLPPDDDGPALPKTAVVEKSDGGLRLRVGKSTLERGDGLWRLTLDGKPREVGHAHGLLVRRLSDRFDRHMHALLGRYVRSGFARWAMSNIVRWRFRELPERIPAARLLELAAMSRTLVDTREYDERPYARVVYYHATYDVTQRLESSPLLGCTSFAAWGEHTANKHLFVGRNFDFDAGEIFDREKAVMIVRAPGQIPFVSIGWPGLTGVVTGLNKSRLFVALHAARSDAGFAAGTPIVFVVREVLERAHSIKEALALLKKAKVIGSQALLLADGDENRAVVVELSPKVMVVREAVGPRIGLANHFLHRKFKGDAANDRLRRYSTSEVRYKRLMQLLRRFRGRIDAPTSALILRNRTAVDDAPRALGHRGVIDAVQATHSVVADLSEMVLWVTRGPHLVGPYVAIDLKPLFGVAVGTSYSPPKNIPPDPLQGSAQLARYRMVVAWLEYASRLELNGKLRAALDYLRRAAAAAPKLPRVHKRLGDLLYKLGETSAAKDAYKTYLGLNPPYLKDVEAVKARM